MCVMCMYSVHFFNTCFIFIFFIYSSSRCSAIMSSQDWVNVLPTPFKRRYFCEMNVIKSNVSRLSWNCENCKLYIILFVAYLNLKWNKMNFKLLSNEQFSYVLVHIPFIENKCNRTIRGFISSKIARHENGEKNESIVCFFYD